MPTLDHLTVVADASARLRDLLADADPDAVIPSCPDWTVDDLLWHLAEVQWFWGTVARDRLDTPGAAKASTPDRPADHAGLVDLAGRATQHLLDWLDGLDDDEHVWSWNGAGTGAWVRRRQAHEATIHAVDADLVTGGRPTLDPDVATDGVDEVLGELFGFTPAWAEFVADERSLVVVASDTGRAWDVDLGRVVGTSPTSGKDHDLPSVRRRDRDPTDAIGPGVTTVGGPAADLDLWLWSRAGEDGLSLGGDPGILGAFRSVIHHGLQ